MLYSAIFGKDAIVSCKQWVSEMNNFPFETNMKKYNRE